MDLGFSPVQASLVFTVYGLVAALAAWSSGVLAEIYGPVRIMRIGAVLWVTLHALFLGLGIGLLSLPLILLFYGLRATAYPLFIYAFVVRIAQVTPRARLASAMGWYWAFYSIGIGCIGTYLPSFTIPAFGYYGTLWMSLTFVALAWIAVTLGLRGERAGGGSATIAAEHRFRGLARGATILAENRSIAIAAVVRVICNLTLFGFPVIMPLYLTSPAIGFTIPEWLRIWGAMFFVTLTDGWGADVVFEASGSERVIGDLMACACPGGVVVLVGIPIDPVPFDVAAAQAKELRFETVFRYANIYDRAIALIASGKVDLKPLITRTFAFNDAVAAFERAAEGRPADVKLQVELAD